MKRIVAIILVLCSTFSFIACSGSTSSGNDEPAKGDPIEINSDNFRDYFDIMYTFDQNSLKVSGGEWKEKEKDSYYEKAEMIYNYTSDGKASADLIMRIKPKSPCITDNVSITVIPLFKNNTNAEIWGTWKNDYAEYASSSFAYSSSDLMKSASKSINVSVNSSFTDETEIRMPYYYTDYSYFSYDYFDVTPNVMITEASGAIYPLEVDLSAYDHITVDSKNFSEYYDVTAKIDHPVVVFDYYFADLGYYWYDSIQRISFEFNQKKDNIFSMRGTVKLFYTLSYLDEGNIYVDGNTYNVSISINNGVSLDSQLSNFYNMSYSEVSCDPTIISYTKLTGNDMYAFADKHVKITIKEIEAKLDVYIG